MSFYFAIVPLFLIIGQCFCQNIPVFGTDKHFLHDVFPENFLFGYSSSAYQIEGGYNEGGKSESNWDYYTHKNPSVVADGSNADVAADSYHKYRDDVASLKKSGAKTYRFSIAWTRILPNGDCSIVNEVGLSYYSNLIDALIENGIEPVVTMYHYDLPQILEAQGGWLNEATVFHFTEYARILFKNFGDRVKIWATFNQANIYCQFAYGTNAMYAPGINRTAAGPYRCAHNLLKAHGLAYRIYDEEFRQSQKGRVGISVWCPWFQPLDATKAEDVAASSRALQFFIGWIINPLLKGDYPPVMRTVLDEKSKAEGRSKSRLPTFSSKWAKIITGTLDYIGVNHYATFYAYPSPQGNLVSPDSNTGIAVDPLWPPTALPTNFVVPVGFRSILNYVGIQYCLDIFVFENGYGENGATGLNNYESVNYYRLYINEMLKAVRLDGIRIMGYTAWSLVDSFEFGNGYTVRFGAFYIDFADPNRRRVPKDSAKYLRRIFHANGFPDNHTHSRNLEDSSWD